MDEAGFYEDEIRIQHDGTVWIVASHLDVQHRFDYLADAMKYATSSAIAASRSAQ